MLGFRKRKRDLSKRDKKVVKNKSERKSARSCVGRRISSQFTPHRISKEKRFFNVLEKSEEENSNLMKEEECAILSRNVYETDDGSKITTTVVPFDISLKPSISYSYEKEIKSNNSSQNIHYDSETNRQNTSQRPSFWKKPRSQRKKLGHKSRPFSKSKLSKLRKIKRSKAIRRTS